MTSRDPKGQGRDPIIFEAALGTFLRAKAATAFSAS